MAIFGGDDALGRGQILLLLRVFGAKAGRLWRTCPRLGGAGADTAVAGGVPAARRHAGGGEAMGKRASQREHGKEKNGWAEHVCPTRWKRYAAYPTGAPAFSRAQKDYSRALDFATPARARETALYTLK